MDEFAAVWQRVTSRAPKEAEGFSQQAWEALLEHEGQLLASYAVLSRRFPGKFSALMAGKRESIRTLQSEYFLQTGARFCLSPRVSEASPLCLLRRCYWAELALSETLADMQRAELSPLAQEAKQNAELLRGFLRRLL